MSHWESAGQSDEWYTPKYIFDALGCRFDLDVAAPFDRTHVPCDNSIWADSLNREWWGFIWMNPPFGGRNGIKPWLDKFFDHGNGICLTPDRTSAPWWQEAFSKADATLFISPKIKFERPNGLTGKSPGCGTTLFATGFKGEGALCRAAAKGIGKLAYLVELTS